MTNRRTLDVSQTTTSCGLESSIVCDDVRPDHNAAHRDHSTPAITMIDEHTLAPRRLDMNAN